jgi:hypothetical protein
LRVRLGRDHARRIQRVAYLLTVHGVLEVLTAAMVAVYIAVPNAVDGAAGATRGALVLPALAALGGGLKVLAGWANRRYRARTLGMTALLSAPLAFGTLACLPTALALSAYGLWVYSHAAVKRAFDLGARGTLPADVEVALRAKGGDA